MVFFFFLFFRIVQLACPDAATSRMQFEGSWCLCSRKKCQAVSSSFRTYCHAVHAMRAFWQHSCQGHVRIFLLWFSKYAHKIRLASRWCNARGTLRLKLSSFVNSPFFGTSIKESKSAMSWNLPRRWRSLQADSTTRDGSRFLYRWEGQLMRDLWRQLIAQRRWIKRISEGSSRALFSDGHFGLFLCLVDYM